MKSTLRTPQQLAISQGMKAHWKQRKAGTKYGNVPTVVDGVKFASKAEAKRDAELQLLQRAGKITNLKRQPRFLITVNGRNICTYVGDWRYTELGEHGRRRFDVVEDKKGFKTKDFALKWLLCQALHPEIEWRLS